MKLVASPVPSPSADFKCYRCDKPLKPLETMEMCPACYEAVDLEPPKRPSADARAKLEQALDRLARTALALLDAPRPEWRDISTAHGRSLVFVPHYGITIALPCSDGTWWDEIRREECRPTLVWPMPPLPVP